MLVEMILIGLASWRLASLVCIERGPFSIFLHLREILGFRHNEDGDIVERPSHAVGLIISCVWCTAIWTTGAAYAVWLVSPVLVMLGAAAAVAVAVEQYIRPATAEDNNTMPVKKFDSLYDFLDYLGESDATDSDDDRTGCAGYPNCPHDGTDCHFEREYGVNCDVAAMGVVPPNEFDFGADEDDNPYSTPEGVLRAYSLPPKD